VADECGRKSNWRLDFFPEYKANRTKTVTTENEEELLQLKEVKNGFYSWIPSLSDLNINLISEDRCEGDDIIASIILNKKSDDMFYIISDDKDFQQLLKVENVMQISLREFKPLYKDGYNDIRCHIAIGDTSDNIPNIKRGYGEKKIASLIESDKFDDFLKTNNLTEIYERNSKLIDMTKIPSEYQTSIIQKYNEMYNKSDTYDVMKMSNILFDLNSICSFNQFI
jgi:5'-3' exonuclease